MSLILGVLAVVASNAGADGVSNVKVKLVEADGKIGPVVETRKVVRTDEEWKKRLTPKQFEIARSKGTERPFCGGLLEEKKPGLFVCVCCDLPLFESTTKFESGTGWPSFFQPVAAENVLEKKDESHGMKRVEIVCARCDAHLGHVFEDGPKPTGRRHCVNGESLRFVADKDRATLAGKPEGAVAPVGSSVVVAGGCFWCVEAVFEQIDGVLDAVSGYAGGTAETANYEAVCTGKTGHAEAVQIIYDPKKVSMETLLKVHFATHDPTTKDRQGPDSGPQYRSAIFYANEKEKELVEAFIADLNDSKAFSKKIVTTIEPLKAFHPAEAYHQNYATCNPQKPYIKGIALPKVEKVREKFKDLVRPETPKK
ncbi:MAG: bifunctional methionine sulfoxide reductase B/A protein [Planctomycetota bacterium]